MAIKEKTKFYLGKEFVFFELSVEKENLNQDWVDFSRPQNMLIVSAFQPVLTNHFLTPIKTSILDQMTFLFFLVLHE